MLIAGSFAFHDGVLHCESVALSEIADVVGTPAYIYNAARIRHNAEVLKAAFDPLGASIHYSLKANANLDVIRMLHDAGLGMDAVSAGEIYRALYAGIPPTQIVFAGVGKTITELLYALETGIGWFNVESRAELDLLNTLAADQGRKPCVALRLNPGIHAQTHHYIATGHLGAKFGMDAHTVAAILAQRDQYPHVTIAGIHIHIGSQLGRVTETVEAVKVAQALAQPYANVRTLNLGGGFPVRYTERDDYPPPAAFADALAPLLNGWAVKIEPGRAIIADAGVLIVSVLYEKLQGAHRFVITDGSMTDLLRPALYGATHSVVPLRRSRQPAAPAIVVGPVCESADVLNRDAALPPLQPGDRLAVLGVGAYGMVMASNYNARPRPPEIIVDGGQWRVSRRRETWDDLLRLEATVWEED